MKLQNMESVLAFYKADIRQKESDAAVSPISADSANSVNDRFRFGPQSQTQEYYPEQQSTAVLFTSGRQSQLMVL